MALDYTVETGKSFGDAVDAVIASTTEHGFGVLHVHELQKILGEKGFPRDPLTLVEICHPGHASTILAADIKLALMLPCRIGVYEHGGATYISALRPTVIAQLYPDADIADVVEQVDRAVVSIVDEAR